MAYLSRDQIQSLHKKYAKDDDTYGRVWTHCLVVYDIARELADGLKEKVDMQLLEQSCLLHDIGSYGFMSWTDFNYLFYQQHALLGKAILLEEGVDARIAEIVRNHLMLGLSKDEVPHSGFKIPSVDYLQSSIEGELLNYADRFHSKDPKFNTCEKLLRKMQIILPKQAAKFTDMRERFGEPDLEILSKKYKHPIL